MSQDAFERACEAVKGPAALGHLLGKSRGVVNHWRHRVPAEHCPRIEQLTGVTCEELRPDLTWVRGTPEAEWPNGKPLLDVTHEVVDSTDTPTTAAERATAAELRTQSEADHATCGAALHPNTPRGTGRDKRHERRHGPCDPREGY